MFNAFVWQLYKESERGKRAIEQCLSLNSSLDKASNAYAEIDPTVADLMNAIRDFAAKECVRTIQQASELFDKLISPGLPIYFSDSDETITFVAEDLNDLIHPVSVSLYIAHPDYFMPYGFTNSFADLKRISELFNLALPPTPHKKDTKGRGRYYAQLNNAFYEFRQSYGLSTAEMYAFLHDFALEFLVENDDVLPEPSKVWPIIAGVYNEDDFQWLADAQEDSLAPWNENPNIRRGDILLIYCIRPHNALCYLARAVTDGFTDPFCHYYNVVWLGDILSTPPITFGELAAHPQLAQSSVVKTRMQGPNSGSFTLEEYDAILAIMASKGQDVSQLPRPRTVSFLPSTELQNERDVEVSLIEPLLLRLGYTEEDWLRQMRLRMGRGERIYPDYVFGAETKRGEERADMVLEAKFTISGDKALRESYAQAVSYAYRLRAEVVMLGAREGLWLFKQKRGSFSLMSFSFYGWEDLQNPDTLFELKKLLVKPKR